MVKNNKDTYTDQQTDHSVEARGRRHRRHRFHVGHRHRHARPSESGEELRKIVLVGNPNVGKSVIFGALTGKYVDVSNYPGTSVEITRGEISVGSHIYQLIDSPGVNGMVPHSEDEEVALDIVTASDVAGVIQVIDAKNFRRGLLLTHQLAQLGLPMVVSLNIYDEAVERGISIDVEALERVFGFEFITTVATEGRGIAKLRGALAEMHTSHHSVRFHPMIEETVAKIASKIETGSLNPRGVALNIIAAEGKIPRFLAGKDEELDSFIRDETSRLIKKLPCPPGYGIQSNLIKHIDSYTDSFLKVEGTPRRRFREKLGFLTMHRLYGLPFIIVVLFILYELVGVFGAGTCVDFMETVIFGGVDENGEFFGFLNPIFIRLLAPLGESGLGGFINELLVGQYGAITVGLTYSIAIVLPIVSLFFVFFGILEDSGYLPRLTVMSNRLFQKVGLNGRAILPIVMGLGCDTMATITTRILETKKERTIATLLLALGIPCSAQLGVVLGMMGAISFWLLLVVIVTVISQLAIVGYAASKVLPGKPASLIAEIPPMRIPKMKNILIKTYFRVKWFMREAVPLFILGTLVLFFLDKLHLLQELERITSPVITGILNLPAESTEAFIVGFLRRDYGAAGLFHLADRGLMDSIQITVGVAVMVLFVPCLANFFVIIKERGMTVAMVMSLFIVIYAVLVGGVLNQILRLFI